MRQDPPQMVTSKNVVQNLNREELEMYLEDKKRDYKVCFYFKILTNYKYTCF